MNPDTVTVRRLSAWITEQFKEWHAIHQLCCLSGNNGAPIARERWDLFGRLWVEPYETIFPQWTYVAEAQSRIVGYLTGCPDTRAFAKAKLWRFSMPLLMDIFRGRYRGNRDAHRFARQRLRFEKEPERGFPRELSRKLRQDYPAHLHMNVEGGWRGSGVGAKLTERFFSDLRSAGVSGVHLYCGADPLEFYRHRGFDELAKAVFHGAPIYALGLRLQD